jgi:hypothetical protein
MLPYPEMSDPPGPKKKHRRVVIEVYPNEEELWRRARVRVAEQGTTLRAWLLALLQRELAMEVES